MPQAKSLGTRWYFLDGIRGYASVAVVFHHVFRCFLWNFSQPYGGLFNFPIDGMLAVYVFFVISGFALSTSFLRSHDHGILSALALRRWLRLSIPVLASSALFIILRKSNALYNMEAGAQLQNHWLASGNVFPSGFRSLLRFSFFDVFLHYEGVTSYNSVLWTLGIEFVGSYLVFALLALFAAAPRRWILYLILVGALYFGKKQFLGFVYGMALADAFESRPFQSLRKSNLGLLLSGVALAAGVSFSTFGRCYYEDKAALATAALLLVFGFITHDRIRASFENRVARALGKISFPLYLVHMAVLHSFASWVYLKCAGQPKATIAFAVGMSTVIPSVLLAIAYLPIEAFAVSTARRFSDFFL